MRFCVNCGRQLRDDEVCTCQQPQKDGKKARDLSKDLFSKKNKKQVCRFCKKFWPFLAGGAVFLIVLIVLLCTLTGGSYKTPVADVVKILNNRETDIVKIAKCLLPDFIEGDAMSLYKTAKDIGYFEDLLDDADDTLQDLFDELDDYYGDDYKVTYEIRSADKLDKDELEDVQDALNDYSDSLEDVIDSWEDMDDDEKEDSADMGDTDVETIEKLIVRLEAAAKKIKKVKVTKGYELKIKAEIEGDEDSEKYNKLVVRVIKVNGDWMIDFTDEETMSFFRGLI